MRYTPEIISDLEPHQIFTFGSNLAGKHGAGAALFAATKFGAEYGVGEGLTGQCYALPTKNLNILTRPLNLIGESFRIFIKCVLDHPELDFLLTKVGCGLASYSTDDIAREFWHGMEYNGQKKIPINLWVPKEFVFTADYEDSVFHSGGRELKEKGNKPYTGGPWEKYVTGRDIDPHMKLNTIRYETRKDDINSWIKENVIHKEKWLDTPNSALNDRTPRDLLESGDLNDIKKLEEMIHHIENGTFM